MEDGDAWERAEGLGAVMARRLMSQKRSLRALIEHDLCIMRGIGYRLVCMSCGEFLFENKKIVPTPNVQDASY